MSRIRLFASFRSRFGRRLLLLYLGCSFVPTAILAILSFRVVSRQLESQGIARLDQTGGILERTMLDRAELVAEDLSQLPAEPAACQRSLTPEAAAESPCDGSLLYGLDALAFASSSGSRTPIFGDSLPLPNLTEPEHTFLNAGKSLLIDEGDASASILLIQGNVARGYLVGRLTSGYLSGLNRDPSNDTSMVSTIVTLSGKIVSDLTRERAGRFPVALPMRLGRVEWTRGPDRMLGFARPIGANGRIVAPRWRLVTSDSYANVLAPMRDFRRLFLLAALLGIVVAVVVAISQIRRSLEPLEALQLGTRRLASQDFDRPVVVPGGDEFAELAASFNRMAEQIRHQFTVEKSAAAVDRAILASVETGQIIGATIHGIREAIGEGDVVISLVDRTDTGTATTYRIEAGDSRLTILGSGPMNELPAAPDGAEHVVVSASVPSAERITPFGAETSELLLLPLRSQGTLLGWIEATWPPISQPSEVVLPRVVGIARHAALALANARMVEQVRHLAFFDSLTGLPNRVSFKRRLSEELARVTGPGQLALFFLDLDNFSRINDTLGHKTGDRLVQEVGRCLDFCCRSVAPRSTVARLGGDEFTVILPIDANGVGPGQMAEALLESLRKPFPLDGHETFVSASIGISVANDDGTDLESVLKNADVAMYQAKRLGRDRYAFYASALGSSATKRLRLENHLRKALGANELTVWYQPIVDLATGSVAGAEGLLRWTHPELGVVSPADFIPVAEENGLITAIGEWVLETVCRQILAWQAEGLPVVPVAVNVSSRQVHDGGIFETVRKALRSSGLKPNYLGLELTESVLMERTEATLETLHALASLGVTISIDDFGTGYSSLSYLKQFPAQSVKIDRTFIRDVIRNPDDAAITSAIVAMGKALGRKIIAEGVEHPEQLELLRRLGCDQVQGYLVGRPAPPEVFAKVLGQPRPDLDLGRLELPRGPGSTVARMPT